MQHLTSTYSNATPPLPEYSMLNMKILAGIVRFTCFVETLCQRVLDGNIGHRGERGLGAEDAWGIERYESMTQYKSDINPLQKTDESMNPYESTMNPIQKTDESMNPLYLMKIEIPFSFLYNIKGFIDSFAF